MLNTYLKNKKRTALTLALCAVILLIVLFAGSCSENKETEENQVIGNYEVNVSESAADTDGSTDGDTEDSASSGEEETATVSGLTIPTADLTSTAKFYGVTVNGTYMQVIALSYGGSYRTAFNTCQICYGSSKAYFKQSGNYLVCQECRSKIALSMVGLTSGSCNPYPILSTNRVQTEDSIIIPDDYLVSCKNLFRNWGGEQL